MSTHFPHDAFSEDEVITQVARLTRRQLVTYIEAEFVKPRAAGDGYVFGSIDIARLELLCDLSEDLDLDETGLAVVISLIDQVHALRQDLGVLARAVREQTPDVRARIARAMQDG